MGWLEGEVVLVTGGGSGLGAAVVDRFLAEGAEVVVLELMQKKVEALTERYGDRVQVLQGDVSDVGDLEACRDALLRRHGRLTALVATQGVWDGNTHLVDTATRDLDSAFDEIFAVNVKGFLLTAKVFVDLLTASKGSMTFTLSNASFSADGGGVLYTASKHASVGVVRQLAFELAPEVRVNGLAPCAIRGSDLRGPQAFGLAEQSQADRPQDAYELQLKQLLPLGRYPSADEYTSLYVVLASSKHSGVMTGQVIVADQGLEVRGLGGYAAAH